MLLRLCAFLAIVALGTLAYVSSLGDAGSQDSGFPRSPGPLVQQAPRSVELDSGAPIIGVDTEPTRGRVEAHQVIGSAGDIRVTVTTKEGLPVDHFTVRLRLRELSVDGQEEVYAETDKDGLAIFTGAEAARLQAQRPKLALRVETTSWPMTHHRFSDFEPGNLDGRPIHFELDLLRLVVTAVEPGGDHWAKRMGVFVSPENMHYDSKVGIGEVCIWCPRGAAYTVRAYRCGLYHDVEATFEAPGSAELERSHTLQLGRMYPAITGRLVMPDGSPAPQGAELYLVNRTTHHHSSDSVKVRKDGRFEYRMSTAASQGSENLFELSLRVDELAVGSGLRTKIKTPPPGVHEEIGDLVLGPLPVLAAGRVVAPKGTRSDWIGIEAEIMESGEWIRHPGIADGHHTHAEGRFCVLGDDPPGPIRVTVDMMSRDDLVNYVSHSRRIYDEPREDLVIRLGPSGWVETTVNIVDPKSELEGETSPGELRLWVTSDVTGEEILAGYKRLDYFDGLWGTQFDEVCTGRARLVYSREAGGAPTASWDLGKVVAGEALVTDVLELGQPEPSLTVSVRMSDFATAPVVFYGEAGTVPLPYRCVTHGGVAQLPRFGGALDVLVVAPGFATSLVTNVAADHEVELLPLPSVVVSLEPTELLEAPPGADRRTAPAAKVTIQPVDPACARWIPPQYRASLTRAEMVELDLSPDGVATVRPACDGLHRVSVEVLTHHQAVFCEFSDPRAHPTIALAPVNVQAASADLHITANLRNAALQASSERSFFDLAPAQPSPAARKVTPRSSR